MSELKIRVNKAFTVEELAAELEQALDKVAVCADQLRKGLDKFASNSAFFEEAFDLLRDAGIFLEDASSFKQALKAMEKADD